jgi:hypothetical protein
MMKGKGRWRVPLVIAFALLPLGSAAAQEARGQAPSPACSAACVTSIKHVTASKEVTTADGTVESTWYPEGPGTVEKLPAPMTESDAVAYELSEQGLSMSAPPVASDARVTRATARASGYASYCVSDTYAPELRHNDAWGYYARSHTAQSCVGAAVSSHRTVTALWREGPWTNLANGSQVGFQGQGIDAYASYNCNHQGYYVYRNIGTFFVTVNGSIVEGPSKQQEDVHSCPG